MQEIEARHLIKAAQMKGNRDLYRPSDEDKKERDAWRLCSFQINGDDWQDLKRLAKELKTSASELLRVAVVEYLDRQSRNE